MPSEQKSPYRRQSDIHRQVNVAPAEQQSEQKYTPMEWNKLWSSSQPEIRLAAAIIDHVNHIIAADDISAEESAKLSYLQFDAALFFADINLLANPFLSDMDREAYKVVYDWGAHLVASEQLNEANASGVANLIARKGLDAPKGVHKLFFDQELRQAISNFIEHSSDH